MIKEKFSLIPGHEKWVDLKEISKGYSGDKKYLVTDTENNKYLLRVSSLDKYEEKKKQFDLLVEVDKLNINTSKPVSFGKLNDEELFTVLSWLEGEDADTAVSKLSDKEIYKLGLEAGKLLNKLHTLPVDASNEIRWIDKFKAKMERKYKAVEECEIKIENIDKIIDFVNNNLHLIEDRKVTFTHGDYHLSNLIVHEGKIGVIDFEKNKLSDPYDDLKPFMWNVFVSEYFETGLINGYFNNIVPDDFFPILKLYAAENLVSFLPWAAKLGGDNLKTAYKVNDSIMKWYDNFNLTIPTWYKGVIKEFED